MLPSFRWGREDAREGQETATPRVAHVTTVDLSLRYLLLNQLERIRDEGYDVVGISADGPTWQRSRRTASLTSRCR